MLPRLRRSRRSTPSAICPTSTREVEESLTRIARECSRSALASAERTLLRLRVSQPQVLGVEVDAERGSAVLDMGADSVLVAVADVEAAQQLRAAAQLTTVRLGAVAAGADGTVQLVFDAPPWTLHLAATTLRTA